MFIWRQLSPVLLATGLKLIIGRTRPLLPAPPSAPPPLRAHAPAPRP